MKPEVEMDNPYFISDDEKKSKKKEGLPDWLNHFNVRDLKALFKSALAVWVYTLLIVINPTLQVLGTAAFLGGIVLFAAPASGIVFINLLVIAMIGLGVGLAWAWGVITMEAALAARPERDLLEKIKHIKDYLSEHPEISTNVDTMKRQVIFNGYFLDARVSVTYFCMIGLFIYLVARVRIAAPKLVLFQMFATAMADVFLVLGPLFPKFEGTIAKIIGIPLATALGIGLCVNVLFFPESTSHVVLNNMKTIMAPMNRFLEACILGWKNPSQSMSIKPLEKTKTQMIDKYKELENNLHFLSLDPSVGRWGAEDVRSLVEPLRQVVLTFIGLLQYQINREEFKTKGNNLLRMVEELNVRKQDNATSKFDYEEMEAAFDFCLRSDHPDREMFVEKSMSAVLSSSEELIKTCQDAVDAIMEAMTSCNSSRWFKRPSAAQLEDMRHKHEAILATLREQEQEYCTSASQHLLQSHEEYFDEEGNLRDDLSTDSRLPLSGIILASLTEQKIANISEALRILLFRIVELEIRRVKTRFWKPTGIRRAFAWAFKRRGSSKSSTSTNLAHVKSDLSVSQGSNELKVMTSRVDEADDDISVTKASAAEQLRSINRSSAQTRSRAGNLFLHTGQWFVSTEGIFAFRVLIVTIALATPALIPSCAGFYWEEKGLWAVIMAQFCLLPYTGSFLFGFLLNFTGTIVGGVIGMLCWYIGSGSGPGNPYGIAAIMAVAIIMLMWARLFAPPIMLPGLIFACATTYLVVGYSWNNGHLASFSHPGTGYQIFWRRVLLVLIGLTTSTIVTFLPRPRSASKHYREQLSESLGSFKDRYALLLSNWKSPAVDLMEVAEKEALAWGRMLVETRSQLYVTKFELSSNPIDSKALHLVCKSCEDLNQCVTQLLLYFTTLPEDLRSHFVSFTGITDDRLITDVMTAVSLVQHSLNDGNPLPAMMPVPVLARLSEAIEHRRGNKQGSALTISKELISQQGFRKYSLALIAFVRLLTAVDELVIVLKGAVGETGNVDLERQR